MMKMIDLAGERFGHLVAQRYLGGGYWVCRCDCGVETRVAGPELRRRVRQCRECYLAARRERTPIGQRYGYWRVVEPAKPWKGVGGRWVVECLGCGSRHHRQSGAVRRVDPRSVRGCPNCRFRRPNHPWKIVRRWIAHEILMVRIECALCGRQRSVTVRGLGRKLLCRGCGCGSV